MRLLVTILFVLFFAVCAYSQGQTIKGERTEKYSSQVSALSGQNAVLFDEWQDTQETCDLDNVTGIPVIPKINSGSQNFLVSRVAPYILQIHSNYFSVLFLDLPPPAVSI